VEVAMEAMEAETIVTDEIDTSKTTEEEIIMTEELINLLFVLPRQYIFEKVVEKRISIFLT